MTFNDRSTDIQGDGGKIQIAPDGMVRFGTDSQINVLFYKKQVLDPALSAQHGRPMMVSRTYVRIQHPGERDYADDPVESKPGIQHRFARQWEQFQKSQEQIPDGTPTEILFPQNIEIAANLHGCGVHTIEQLAALQDSAAMNIGMGVTDWKNRAKSFLDKANSHVGYHQWQREKATLENKLEVQENQMGQLRAQLDKVLAQLQGVPGAMIPQGVGPQAQAHAASVVLPLVPRMDWTVASSPVPLPQPVYPLPEQGVQSSGAEIQQPVKRHRGRPRKVLHHPV